MVDLVLLAVLATVFGGAAGAFAGWLLLRSSGPIVTAEALQQFGRIRTEWQAFQVGVEGMLESMDELAEVVRRRRQRFTAQEHNDKVAAGAKDGPADKASLIARARAQGHPV